MVELFRHRVNGEEPSSCVHETRLGVVKFTGTLLCLSFLACEQVVGTRGGVLGIEQASVGCVVECGEGVAACVRYCPCAAQMVGDVVVCRPAVSLKCCPAACNGKALGGYCAALQFPSSKIVKGEWRIKQVHLFFYPEPHPIFEVYLKEPV